MPKLPKLSFKRKTGAHELFPGVDRPTFILAQMAASQMLKDYSRIMHREWNDGRLVITWSTRNDGTPYSFDVTIKGKTVNFLGDKESAAILAKAVAKAKDLKEQKKIADAATCVKTRR